LKKTKYLTLTLALLLVVAFTYLMTDFARQKTRQAIFIDQIENARQSLSILPAPATDLQSHLDNLTAEYTQALEALSDNTLNSTSVIDSLLVLADTCNLKITPVTSDSWVNKKVGDSVYKILPLKLQVQGSLNSLIDYVKKIDDSQKYPNLAIAGIDIQNTNQAVHSAGSNSDFVTANLSLEVVIRLPSNQ
jgi:hypothetical protein